MITRRNFLAASAVLPAFASKTALSHKNRVDRALKGDGVDRPPFTHWHHFGLEKEGPEKHAAAILDYHRRFRTDLVKVMSDFPYPKPDGPWYSLNVSDSPFAQQIRALELIRDGLAGDAYFVETIFNPYKVAENLSSPEDVVRLRKEKPQVLLDALAVIGRSEANHAKRAIGAGASGVFLAIANAQPEFMSESDYAKFSEPFDRMVLDAVKGAPLNTLHLHGDHVYVDHFVHGWPATTINYSVHGTNVPIEEMRKKYSGVLMGGIDEKNYRTLSEAQLRAQWEVAQRGAGKRFILAPGCSVPNESTDAELDRMPKVVGA